MLDVLFFGMTGLFSSLPLQKLIEGEVSVKAVMMPAAPAAALLEPRRLAPPPRPPSDLPLIEPYLEPDIRHLAWANHLPVWEVGSLADEPTLKLLTTLQPDLIVVACFPRLFPAVLLDLPRYGCVNLHPALLPAYRGPAPLFWMARQGEPQAGVTLHFLDEGLDTGDIIAQTALAWPDGISGNALEQQCAAAGADLLFAAIERLTLGNPLPRSPQSETGASYFPWPTEPDFIIPTHWTAQRAFNFIRAAGHWPLAIALEGKQVLVRAAIAYDPQQSLEQAYLFKDDELWVQFSPGVLRIKVTP